MSFFSGFRLGAQSFFKSFNLIFEKGLWHYLLYPFILLVVFWIGMVIGLFFFRGFIDDYVSELLKLSWVPDSGHWLSWLKPYIAASSGVLGGIISWLITYLIMWMFAKVIKYVVLIVLSPVLALASEAADEKLTGKKYPFSFSQLMKDILRGVSIALRNMFIEYGLLLAGFLLIFIPVLGIILFGVYGVFMLFVSWYFYGFSMLDYSCERNKMGVRESINFISRNKGTACGIGFFYWLIFMIPYAGIILAPIPSVVGATIAFNDIKAREEANKLNIAPR